MMIYVNCKRPNVYKEVLDRFSEDNKPMYAGVVKSATKTKYRWMATYLFKNRNNTQTNSHRAWLCFYGNNDMLGNEYGSIDAIFQGFRHLNGTLRTKIPYVAYELTTNQYKRIGQEYTEFDGVEYFDFSDTLYSNDNYGSESTDYDVLIGDPVVIDGQTKRMIRVIHRYGDAPAIVGVGYVIHYSGGLDTYYYDCPPDSVEIGYNEFRIILGDLESDVYNLPYFKDYVETLTPYASGHYSDIGGGALVLISCAGITGIGHVIKTHNGISELGFDDQSHAEINGTGSAAHP
jgi:hypothetical protein